MNDEGQGRETDGGERPDVAPGGPSTGQSIEWYHVGQIRSIDVAGVEVLVRLVGRKGRRARIAITAPAGATFRNGGI